jgi:GTP-binding protein
MDDKQTPQQGMDDGQAPQQGTDDRQAPQQGIDYARIHVKAGEGGNGVVSFRREKFAPLGGPDGGDGGRGGSVYLKAVVGQDTLLDFARRRHFKAERGGNGAGQKMHGKKGQDLVIPVPLGTLVRTDEGFLADLTRPDEMVMVARGGRGGLGNVHFKTSTNQAPRVAQRGEPAEEAWLTLELKTLADVGLLGYPNVGKSSLLAAISRARPKIGAYPFTTITPNLGVVENDTMSFVVADIPGLIEGAHKGVGLGHLFLRHVERARLLLHILDGAAEDPLGDYDRVRQEIELYDSTLAQKPEVVAVNKLDLESAREAFPRLKQELEQRGRQVAGISAATGEGVPELLALLRQEVDRLPLEAASPAPGVRVYRLAPEEDGWTVEREDHDTFVVRGKRVERMAAMTDPNNSEAIEMLQRSLAKMGILEALEQAGAEFGSTVRIGPIEVEWGE